VVLEEFRVTRAPLTKRQRDIASLLVEGKQNKEIARRLGISEHTVKSQLLRAYRRLGINNRTQLAIAVRSAS
jgi:DNA-binding CsgD family transcriptional regulator